MLISREYAKQQIGKQEVVCEMKNYQLKDENKYEESTTILIQRLVFCDTNTTTWGNIWKIANSIQ